MIYIQPIKYRLLIFKQPNTQIASVQMTYIQQAKYVTGPCADDLYSTSRTQKDQYSANQTQMVHVQMINIQAAKYSASQKHKGSLCRRQILSQPNTKMVYVQMPNFQPYKYLNEKFSAVSTLKCRTVSFPIFSQLHVTFRLNIRKVKYRAR